MEEEAPRAQEAFPPPAGDHPRQPIKSPMFGSDERRILPRDTTTKVIFDDDVDLTTQLSILERSNINIDKIVIVIGSTGRIGRKLTMTLSRVFSGTSGVVLQIDRLSSKSRASNSLHYKSVAPAADFPRQLRMVCSRYNNVDVVLCLNSDDVMNEHASRQFKESLLLSCNNVNNLVIVTCFYSKGWWVSKFWYVFSCFVTGARVQHEQGFQTSANEAYEKGRCRRLTFVHPSGELLSVPQSSGTPWLVYPWNVFLVLMRFAFLTLLRSVTFGLFGPLSVTNGEVSKAVVSCLLFEDTDDDQAHVKHIFGPDLRELSKKFKSHIEDVGGTIWMTGSSFPYIKETAETIRSYYLPHSEDWKEFITFLKDCMVFLNDYFLLPVSLTEWFIETVTYVAMVLSRPDPNLRRVVDNWHPDSPDERVVEELHEEVQNVEEVDEDGGDQLLMAH